MTQPCSLVPRKSRLIDRSPFDLLHPQGRRLISSWAARGGDVAHEADASAYFEGFIYLWFALNAWGSCVTGTDTDRDWLDAVASDLELARMFDSSIGQHAELSAQLIAFADLWPIFKSSQIRRRGIFISDGATRQERVRLYLEKRIAFEPSCWYDHTGTRPPADWMHTLKTLYRVRCNLFHGEKSLNSENDRLIVSTAYPVLRHILVVLCLI